MANRSRNNIDLRLFSVQAAYITVISPYAILLVLLIRGAMLEGAGAGVLYFIYPHLEKLLEPQVRSNISKLVKGFA